MLGLWGNILKIGDVSSWGGKVFNKEVGFEAGKGS